MKELIKLMLLFAVICSFVFLNANTVLADLIVPGTKSIDFCYTISNINDYPNYVFLLHGIPSPSYEIIDSGQCFSFYKLSMTSLYAIQKTNFNEQELKGGNYTDIRNYFENDPRVIHSNIQLNSYGAVPENDPLNKVVTVLKIVSLNENNLVIQKSKIIYTYTDGTSEEKTFQSQDVVPEPSRKAILPWWFTELWYIVLPVIALIAIISILLLRRSRK